MDSTHDQITKQIEDALMKDPRTKKAVIDVGFNRGVITLTGNVKTMEASQAAEEIARSQPEVLQVVNELKIG